MMPVDPNISKPERMARRPHFQGIPIPALTFVGDNGIPNFKIVDDQMVRKMKDEHKCGLCGEPLDYWIAFMVSEEEARTRFIFESPNHEECLRYAFNVCPWLYYSNAKYNSMEYTTEGYKVKSTHPDRESMNARPPKLGIYICNGYKNVINRGVRVCKAASPKRLDWIEGK